MAAAVVGVFTSYIVPMMFGLLGTLAGLVRTISGKVRESLLSPRDYKLSLASVPLGLVAGLAVGLIFSSSAISVQGLVGQTTATSLSAAALAFLAGYGADSFFTMLDALLRRVFASSNRAASDRERRRAILPTCLLITAPANRAPHEPSPRPGSPIPAKYRRF